VSATAITRTLEPDGSVVIADSRARFAYRRVAPGVLDIAISGTDSGQFGTATLDEVALALVRERPLELFIDASEASMPTVGVSRDWTRFFALNRDSLKRVSVLVSSKSVELTVAIAQHLSQTGKLIQIYSDAELFAQRREAAASLSRR